VTCDAVAATPMILSVTAYDDATAVTVAAVLAVSASIGSPNR